MAVGWFPGKRYRLTIVASLAVACMFGAGSVRAQEPAAPQALSEAQLQKAIDTLGVLDYAPRTEASRAIRRAPGAQAVPALLRAVAEHADGYVRYRALVLLTGFNDPRTKDAMQESLASPNDRLRAVAYSYFEHHPEPAMVPRLLGALETEEAEFVRPTLIRAVAAAGSEAPVRTAMIREAGRGEDFFRSVVIEALGDYKADYAVDTLAAIAQLDGPLVDDAALALGKIGNKRALATLTALQRTAPKTAQPFVAAGICLLGINCPTHENYLIDTLKFADQNVGYQELLRGAASGLSALAVSGRPSAAAALCDIGASASSSTRAPVALALATVALRNTPLALSILQQRLARAEAIALLSEGFDMLEEDLDKERFFALVRRTYWTSPEGSPERELMRTLIGQLDF
jgi:HEAT repeat protein